MYRVVCRTVKRQKWLITFLLIKLQSLNLGGGGTPPPSILDKNNPIWIKTWKIWMKTTKLKVENCVEHFNLVILKYFHVVNFEQVGCVSALRVNFGRFILVEFSQDSLQIVKHWLIIELVFNETGIVFKIILIEPNIYFCFY